MTHMKTSWEVVAGRLVPYLMIDMRQLRYLYNAIAILALYDLFELIRIYEFLVGSSSLVTLQMAAREGQIYGVFVSNLIGLFNPTADLVIQNLVLVLFAISSVSFFFSKLLRLGQVGLISCYLFLFWRWPQFTHDGDFLLIWILIWTLFLPNPTLIKNRYFASCATATIYLQIIFLFTLASLNKYGSLWWNGAAVQLAMKQLNMLTPIGMMVNLNSGTTWFLTYVTLFSEIILPFWIFFRFKNYLLKKVGIAMISVMMIGIILLFRTGTMAPAAMLLLLPIAAFPKEGDFIERDICLSPARNFALATFLVVGLMSYLYNLAVLPKSFREALAPYSVGYLVPIKQSWRMFAGNPPDAAIALRFYSEEDGAKTYRNFFDLSDVPAADYFDDNKWYSLNVRYRRFQKYFERVYLGRGDHADSLNALYKSLCQRLPRSVSGVGAELWIKDLRNKSNYRSRPLSEDAISCYHN